MSGTDRDLEALAQDLARYRSVGAPAALRSRVRAEIMAAPVVTRPVTGGGWVAALRPILAAVLVIAVLAAAGGSAAAGSLPGDPAFAIKRAVEDVQVALATDDARLDVLTGLVDRRLAELETLSARRPSRIDAAVTEYEAAIARMEQQLSIVARGRATAARDAAIVRATAAAEDHIARLRTLEEKLPSAAQPGIERAIDAQRRIHESDRGPAPQSPGASPSEPEAPSRPGAAPGGAPGTAPGAAPSARPAASPSRPDRTASPTHR